VTIDPLFLDVEDILDIHSSQLQVHGGAAGVRDRGLLESAIAQPQSCLLQLSTESFSRSPPGRAIAALPKADGSMATSD
jgi:hypothetical protein